jgi:hypothetical protein
MARKRASLKDKGEEILGVKRGGQGADILFGTGTETAPTAPAVEQMPQGEADLDGVLGVEAEAPGGVGTLSAVAETPTAETGMPSGEAGMGEELDLDSLLSAEAEAAQAEATLPELATTPAAAAPPPPEPLTPPPPPPVMERPLPTPLPSIPASYEPVGVLSPAVERPAPAPPPLSAVVPPAPVVVRPVPVLPPSPEFAPPAPAALPLPEPPPPSPAAVPPPPAEVPPPPALAVAVEPPSTVTGAPDLSAPRPPRYIQMAAADFDLLAEEVTADAAAAALLGVPEGVRLTPEQRTELLRRRSVQEDLAELDRAINAQYDRILSENVSVNKGITDWCQKLLAQARIIVLNRQVDRLALAEWYVEQVRARLDRANESRKQANLWAVPITIWGVIWFGIFVYLIFNPLFFWQLLRLPAEAGSDAFLVPQVFLRSLFFGGIGGVAAVFYHLFKYMQDRSFDSQYVLSYAAKPFMGMILGSMVYLTIFVVMRVLGLAPGGLQQEGTQTVTDVMYTAILFFVALASGFKENLAFDLLSRVVKSVLGTGEEKEESPIPSPEAKTTGS